MVSFMFPKGSMYLVEPDGTVKIFTPKSFRREISETVNYCDDYDLEDDMDEDEFVQFPPDNQDCSLWGN